MSSHINLKDQLANTYGFEPSIPIINFPTFKLKKDTHYKKFLELYEIIKAAIQKGDFKDPSQKKIIIPSFNDIKSNHKIMGISIKNIPSHYNNLSQKLYNFIQKTNSIITTIASKKPEKKQEGKITHTISSSTIHKKNNIFLLKILKNLRKDQPQCSVESYKIPSFLSSTSLEKSFEGVSNSMFINNQIFNDIIECFNVLQKMINETISVAITTVNFINLKSEINRIIADEFRFDLNSSRSLTFTGYSQSPSLNHYGRPHAPRYHGGSLKKTKKRVQFKSLSKSNTKKKLKMHSKFHKKPNSS